MISMRLTPDLEARLDALAKRTGRTKTFYVRQAVIEHLDDIEAAQLALERWEDVRSGRTSVISLAELKAEYGLDDSDLEGGAQGFQESRSLGIDSDHSVPG